MCVKEAERMRTLLKGGQVYQSGAFLSADVAVEKGLVVDISSCSVDSRL